MFSKIPQNILNRFHLQTTKNLAGNRKYQAEFRSLRNKIPLLTHVYMVFMNVYFFHLVLAMLVLVDHQKETIFINAVAVKSNSITCRQYHGVLLGCILRAATSF